MDSGVFIALYLNIVIVWREALGLLGRHVDVRANQSAKKTLQFLLDSPQLILSRDKHTEHKHQFNISEWVGF